MRPVQLILEQFEWQSLLPCEIKLFIHVGHGTFFEFARKFKGNRHGLVMTQITSSTYQAAASHCAAADKPLPACHSPRPLSIFSCLNVHIVPFCILVRRTCAGTVQIAGDMAAATPKEKLQEKIGISLDKSGIFLEIFGFLPHRDSCSCSGEPANIDTLWRCPPCGRNIPLSASTQRDQYP